MKHNEDVPEVEIKLILRNKVTGTACEFTFERTMDVQLSCDENPIGAADWSLWFKAYPPANESGFHTYIQEHQYIDPFDRNSYED